MSWKMKWNTIWMKRFLIIIEYMSWCYFVLNVTIHSLTLKPITRFCTVWKIHVLLSSLDVISMKFVMDILSIRNLASTLV